MGEGTKKVRKKLSKNLEAKILLACARRCALCWVVNFDGNEKHGQLAHIDRDPSNNDEDNLVWLCLTHHSIYDSKSSEHKNYTALEIKGARRKLVEFVSSRKKLLQDKGEKSLPIPSDADRKTLEDLLRNLPSGGGMGLLREQNFAAPFQYEWFEDIRAFYFKRKDAPEFEFLDSELEDLRKRLLESIRNLLASLSRYTWFLSGSQTHLGVPAEWEEEQPDRYDKALKEIHRAADDTCQSYDSLVREGRKRLLV
jgi:hypothetical protein